MLNSQVEAALLSSNYVESIMVYADPFHNYCVALVVPSRPVLEKWAQEYGIQHKDFSELCDKVEAVNEIKQSLSKVCFLSMESICNHCNVLIWRKYWPFFILKMHYV